MLYQLTRTIDGKRFAALVCTEIVDLANLPYRDRFDPELAVYFNLLHSIASQHQTDKRAQIIYPKRKVIAGFSEKEAENLFFKWQESGDYAWSRDNVNLIDRAIDGYQRTYATGERHVTGAIARRRNSFELLIMVNRIKRSFSSN
jgi:hypothetical protein